MRTRSRRRFGALTYDAVLRVLAARCAPAHTRRVRRGGNREAAREQLGERRTEARDLTEYDRLPPELPARRAHAPTTSPHRATELETTQTPRTPPIPRTPPARSTTSTSGSRGRRASGPAPPLCSSTCSASRRVQARARIERRVKTSGLVERKTLEAFDWAFQPDARQGPHRRARSTRLRPPARRPRHHRKDRYRQEPHPQGLRPARLPTGHSHALRPMRRPARRSPRRARRRYLRRAPAGLGEARSCSSSTTSASDRSRSVTTSPPPRTPSTTSSTDAMARPPPPSPPTSSSATGADTSATPPSPPPSSTASP